MSRLVAVIAGIVLSGCWPGPRFVTRCGVEMYYDESDPNYYAPNFTEDAVQEMENRLVHGFPGTVTDPAFSSSDKICAALRGHRLFTKHGMRWFSPMHNSNIVGLTNCWSGASILAERDGAPLEATALVHELVHRVQRCESPAPTDEGHDSSHSNWERANIFKAIDFANTP